MLLTTQENGAIEEGEELEKTFDSALSKSNSND